MTRCVKDFDIRLRLLGTGTCAVHPARSPAGLLVEIGEEMVLVDCGWGVMTKLARLNLTTSDIGRIMLTHVHPDHSADLVPLLFSLKNHPGTGYPSNAYLYGPPGFCEFFDSLKGIYGSWILSESYDVEVMELGDETRDFHGYSVETMILDHGTPNVGYRFTSKAGHVLCYSGDTGYTTKLVMLAKTADLLVIDCSFPDKWPVEGHLTTSLSCRIARDASAKRVVLTHRYPICDEYDLFKECKSEYDGEVIVGEDMMVLEI